MDPRKAAKVTAPDLLQAFHSDTNGVGGGSDDESPARVWLVLFHEDDGAVSAIDYRLVDLEAALTRMRDYLSAGEGHGAAIVVSADMPDLFKDAIDNVSQLEQ